MMDDDEDTQRFCPPAPEDVRLDATITEQTLAAWKQRSIAGNQMVHETSRPVLPTITFGSDDVSATNGAKASSVADLQVLGVLGEGGMGRVYLARQHSLKRDVAIKTVRDDISSEHRLDEARRAIVSEARITGSLEHPNIVPVHQLGLDGGQDPVLVMKRVEGFNWRQLLYETSLEKISRLPVFRGDALVTHVETLMQVCNAIHYAHARGIAHRDIKPDNVMIGEFGEVYLVDWGVACPFRDALETPGGWETIVGTPVYLAPEMVLGGAITPQTDVFLLGAVLHEVLTRTVRHEGATLPVVFFNAAKSKPVSYAENVPAELGALANRATSADPALRPASALEFRRELANWLTHRGSLTLTQTATQTLARLGSLLKNKPLDQDAFARASIECRFGYAQALREWPENKAARDGLHGCIELLVQHHLDHDHPAVARALLAELPSLDEALSARVEAAEVALVQAQSRERAAQQVAHENDLRISARQRRRFFTVLAALSTFQIALTFVFSGASRRAFNPAGILRFAIGLLSVVSIVLLVGRRALLRTEINRKLSLLPLVAAFALLLHRIQGTYLQVPVPHIIAGDLLVLGVVGITSTVTVLPRFGVATLSLWAASLVASLHPEWARLCMNFGGGFAMISLMFLWPKPKA